MRSSILTTAALTALAMPVLSQGSMNLDKTTPGTLGGTLTLAWNGATPGRVMLVIPSLNTGPLPLSILDPADPRILRVGTDLGSSWFLWPVNQSTGTIPLPLPNALSLHGASLRFQTLTFPGSPRVFGEMSNAVQAQFGAAGTGAPLAPGLNAARALSVVIADRDDDAGAGNFVIAGGGRGTFLSAIGLASTERYGFREMNVQVGPTMSVARAFPATVELPDGRTLLTGGVDAVGNVLASCEIYNPTTNAFQPARSMPGGPRAVHDAVVLQDGRVLVAGGTSTFTDPVAALAATRNTTEIYNPSSDTWTTGPALPFTTLAFDLTRLSDGRVLLSGGFQITFVIGFPVPLGAVASCWSLNAAATTWTPAPSMNVARAAHFSNTVLLTDGRVLVTGGTASGPDLTQASGIAQAEVFDPGSNSWSPLPNMAVARAVHSATLLPDGRVVVAGGASGTLLAPLPIANVEVFVPGSNSWQVRPGLSSPRGGHAAALTPDGLLVLFGGQGAGGTTSLSTVETLRP